MTAISDVRRAVIRRTLAFAPLIEGPAKLYKLDPVLVAALICQESLGNPYAIRVERGFWRRYLDGIMALVTRTKSVNDDKWAQYPDLTACSYGLMQIMYVVALELEADFSFPTELCEPSWNLYLGCRHLANKIRVGGGDVDKGLLAYNGGGDPEYPNKVRAWERDVRVLWG